MVNLLHLSPSFRRLFWAHAMSRAGDAFNNVALLVLVFRLTGSGAGVAATVVFEVLPVLLLGPVAGVVTDRLPRRSVMIVADLMRAGLALLLVVNQSSVPAIFFVAFGLSSGALLFNPAASSLMPEITGEEHVVGANTALWTVAVVAQILVAPLAGAIIGIAGVGVAFAVNAASYVLSAFALMGLRAGRDPAAVAVRGWHAVAEGIGTVRRHPLLARLALVQVMASLSAGATGGLLVVLASDWLPIGPGGFGVLLSAIGIGAATGPLLLRRFIRPANGSRLFGPMALRGAVDLTLAGFSQPLVAGGALALYGVGTSTGMIAYQSTLQTVVAAEVRGRVFALYDVLWNFARLVSLGLGGLLADAVGIRAVYVLGGALLIAAATVGLLTPVGGGRDNR